MTLLPYAEEPGPVDFLLIYPDAPVPKPAARDAGGSLPIRAVQLCPPISNATGFGWHVFPPLDFALLWDGEALSWSPLDADNQPTGWMSLSGGVEGYLPGGIDALGEVPEHMREDLPKVFDDRGQSFINADPRTPNQCEIMLGLMARTAPGWGLLMRGLANCAPARGYQVLEGILDTEWSRTLIPVVMRVTEQHRVVRFHRRIPIALLQPVPWVAYETEVLQNITVRRGLQEFTGKDWEEFVTSRSRRIGEVQPGSYRRVEAEARRTRRLSRMRAAVDGAWDDRVITVAPLQEPEDPTSTAADNASLRRDYDITSAVRARRTA
jgi:Family of unknown function (DUF6065)